MNGKSALDSEVSVSGWRMSRAAGPHRHRQPWAAVTSSIAHVGTGEGADPGGVAHAVAVLVTIRKCVLAEPGHGQVGLDPAAGLSSWV